MAETAENRLSHAQDGEDLVALDYFAGRGPLRLLDVGAFDGMNCSNSRLLIENHGWSAILVEPGLAAFRDLLRHRGDNADVLLVHGVLGLYCNRMSHWFEHSTASGDAERRASMASTTERVQAERVVAIHPTEDEDDWRHLMMPQLDIQTLLAGAVAAARQMYWIPQQPMGELSIEYVSIDTEGTSIELLEGMDLTLMSTELVCVEHNERSSYLAPELRFHDRERAVAHCSKHGLSEILFDNGVNIICARPKEEK